MKPALLAALKWLALRGAVRRPVHVSSGQLAKELDVTQQSGARYLLELADRGLLERRLVRGGQMVRLLQPARDLLRREFADYSLIFDAQPEITLTGVLETGLGEGGYYISRTGYTGDLGYEIWCDRGDALKVWDVLLEAGAIRFKPLVLTALAAMIGAVVILFDPIFQGLAISLLFGLASSTLLTVLVIPAIYVVLRDDGRPADGRSALSGHGPALD